MKAALWVGWVGFVVAAGFLLSSAWTDDNRPFLTLHTGMAILVAVPPSLATAATRGRRSLYVAAAIVSWPLGGMLWSAAPLLWIPALLYARAFVRAAPRPTRLPAATSVAVPVLLALAALWVLLAGTEDRCTTSGNSTTCASVPTTFGAAASAALAAATIGAGWVLAEPRRQRVFASGAVTGTTAHQLHQKIRAR